VVTIIAVKGILIKDGLVGIPSGTV